MCAMSKAPLLSVKEEEIVALVTSNVALVVLGDRLVVDIATTGEKESGTHELL